LGIFKKKTNTIHYKKQNAIEKKSQRTQNGKSVRNIGVGNIDKEEDQGIGGLVVGDLPCQHTKVSKRAGGGENDLRAGKRGAGKRLFTSCADCTTYNKLFI